MTQKQGHEDLDLPVGKWIAMGLGGVLLLVIGFFVFQAILGPPEAEPGPATTIRPQVSWSIVLTEGNGSEVTLKGDEPVGFPTEIWVDDELIARQVGETFEWTMDADPPVPTAVYDIDQIVADNADDPETMCAELNAEIEHWITEIESAQGEQHSLYSEAFGQYALDHARANDCEINE